MERNKRLCEFTVKNFKSIRDEVTFDMQAAAISEHEDRIIKDTDGESYLPVSAVYGPNGGGKSNVLEALHSLVTKVLRPLYATSNNEEIAMKMKKLVIEPFAFDEETRNEPTEFELNFRTAMAEYRYELIVKKEVIEYERLDRIKLETGRKSALFERDEDEITLKGAFARLKTSDELSDTLPLLSYLGITYSKNEVVQDVLDWFDEEIDFLNYGNPMQELRMAVSKSEDVKRLMLQMIQEMDLDIVDFRVEEKENDRIEVFKKHKVDENEAALMEALELVKTGSVTYAVRDTEMDGIEIKEGNMLGLIEGKINKVGDDYFTVAEGILESMVDEDSELITIFYGKDVDENKIEEFTEKLEEKYEDCDIQMYKGDQPLYYFIMAVE